MNTELAPEIETYQARVRDLYQQIRSWLSDQPLKLAEEETELHEEAYGRYYIPRLVIRDTTNRPIATIEPIGASIIAADGRVDLVGSFDRQVIVYFTADGPAISSRVSEAGQTREEHHRPLFRGIVGDGWYWIENSRLGRAKPIEQELFLDLLREVSDNGS